MDLMGAIDFRKGCYIGQELTIRTRHRGVVRKRVLPCVVYAEGQTPPAELVYDPLAGYPGVDAERIPEGATIEKAGGGGGRRSAAGKWLGGVGNIGLALCRLEVMTDMVPLPGEPSTFDPAREVEVEVQGEEGKKLRVKAFVPEWMREQLKPDADGEEDV